MRDLVAGQASGTPDLYIPSNEHGVVAMLQMESMSTRLIRNELTFESIFSTFPGDDSRPFSILPNPVETEKQRMGSLYQLLLAPCLPRAILLPCQLVLIMT